MKKCTKCGEIKPITEFYKNPGNLDGYHGWCKECHRKWRKNYKAVNRDIIRQKDKEYRLNHPNSGKRQLKYREAHREILKERYKEQYKKKMLDPTSKLSFRTHTSICNSLAGRKHGKKWEDIVGYTVEDLKKHLEKQFTEGMSWNNYGKWHLDHIIPLSVFNYSSPCDFDFKRCWSLRNLQPLWGFDNLRKNNKLVI
jgi:hypothetical protein